MSKKCIHEPRTYKNKNYQQQHKSNLHKRPEFSQRVVFCMLRFVAGRSSWPPGHDDMVVFDFDAPASDLMILTDKASLPSKRLTVRHDLPRGSFGAGC